jgi:sugar O-acyltransferase (sialic acid O-acetyltransferase NeuD family)
VTDAVLILGAGGFARELYWFVRDVDPRTRIAFVADAEERAERDMGDAVIPIVRDWDFSHLPFAPGRDGRHRFLVGVAEPEVKRVLVQKALAAGLVPAPTLVHPRSLVRPDCRIGVGGCIAAVSMLTTGATLGDYVLVLDTTIGHDDVVGDYVTCYPGCRVSGGVTLGEDVILGAGTVIRNGVRVAPRVRTGALACVVKDADEPGVTLVGVPARKLDR